MLIRELLVRFDWISPTEGAVMCMHNHKLGGTGAIFFQSQGLLYCNLCKGFQLIRHPLK